MLKKVLILVLIASSVLAVDYTFSTNAAQETKLTRLRTLLNASGASYASNQALITDVCGTQLTQMYNSEEAKDLTAWLSVINSLTQNQREALCTAASKTLVNGRCQ